MNRDSLLKESLDYQIGVTSDALTSRAGLPMILELAMKLGVVRDIAQALPKPGSNRGFQPYEYILPLILMFCGGGRTLEDLREIIGDQALRKVCHLTHIPSPDAVGQWLRRMRKHLRRLSGPDGAEARGPSPRAPDPAREQVVGVHAG